MPKRRLSTIDCPRVELDGARYVIVRESVFVELCRQAGVTDQRASSAEGNVVAALDVDRVSLADKLMRRRQAVGLSQAELARRAGIRPETLNRIERGRTTPDFATVRKLVLAINAAELDSL
jgi:DNA-binding XRE family transcriptional regulator